VSGSSGTTNRLAQESSPYLRLHQHNPVDWHPWGEEAIELARAEDKPIFLSVGYSTCYWCHVMERESFSDAKVAELMNREFISIKVDREERPELDEIYMTATQAMTGHGGWPNSVFLTHQLEPFFAGTYFPPEDRHGQPSFTRVLVSLAEAWKERRADVEEQGRSAGAAIRHYLDRRSPPALERPGREVARRAYRSLEQRFDGRWGGFGGAPKFPTPSNLFLLEAMLDHQPRAAEMLTSTLEQMARGGLFDQLGGGFHRYATDAEWKIPHFEKMLYDNGLLLELYSRQWARGGSEEMASVVRQTAGFLEREMSAPDGAFWSAMDAETDGNEGAFYVWTRDELDQVLGEEDAGFLAPLLGFDGSPFFEGRYYVMHRPRPLLAQAEARRMSLAELTKQVEPLERRLFEHRSARPRLSIDDKILADWNGMAIAGLAVAGRLLPSAELTALAVRAAEAVLTAGRDVSGVLLHSWRDGVGRVRAFLSDYAFLIRGLLELHASTGDESWVDRAVALDREQRQRLADPLGGFFSSEPGDDLLVRSKEVIDGAVPAANAVAVLNLQRLGEITGEADYFAEADRAVRSFATIIEQQPEAARMMVVASLALLGEDDGPAADEAETAGPPMQQRAAEAVKISLEQEPPNADGWRSIRIQLEIEEGLHLQANPAGAEYLVPTTVAATELKLRDLEYPAGEAFAAEFSDEQILVYSGTVSIRGQAQGHGTLQVTYQACGSRGCLPPVKIDLQTGGSAPAAR